LFADGQLIGGSSITAAGGTLGGIGIIGGPVTVATNGTISPGDTGTPVGALEIDNTVVLSGTTLMDLNKGGSVLNDSIVFASSITYGGTLRLNIIGPALVAGDEFGLFNASSYSGAFASIVPASPGSGLAWDTSQLTVSGLLRVVSQSPPQISSIMQSGTNVVINGTGGPPGGSYAVLSSTNVTLPRASWTPVATNMFDGSGNFSFTNAATLPQQFFLLRLQ
jgi:hypothetical protein